MPLTFNSFAVPVRGGGRTYATGSSSPWRGCGRPSPHTPKERTQMTHQQPTPMEKAATIVGEHLMPAAVEGLDQLCAAIDDLSDSQVRACLIFAVFFDRVQQRDQPVNYTLNVPALEALSTAAGEGVAEVRDVAVELPIETACEALGELIYLHREIKVTEALARTTATLN